MFLIHFALIILEARQVHVVHVQPARDIKILEVMQTWKCNWSKEMQCKVLKIEFMMKIIEIFEWQQVYG